jgi:Tfp pilus assembly protein PilO
MLAVVGVVAVIAAAWFLAIAPRRAESQRLDAQIAQARQVRDAAVSGATQALTQERGHASDQAVIAELGQAVPSDDQTASLIYQLDAAAGSSHVDFRAVQLDGTAAAPAVTPAPPAAGATGASGTTATPATGAAATQAAAAPLPPGATIGPAGLSKLPLSLTFQGGFADLDRFLRRVQAFTTVQGQVIKVRGRLLEVDGISLAAAPSGFPHIQASLTVSAFIAPPATPATATAPAAGAGSAGAPTASATPATTSATVIGAGG